MSNLPENSDSVKSPKERKIYRISYSERLKKALEWQVNGIPTHLIRNSNMTDKEKLLYEDLLSYGENPFPSEARLARDINCSVSTIKRIKTSLKARGLLTWETIKNKADGSPDQNAHCYYQVDLYVVEEQEKYDKKIVYKSIQTRVTGELQTRVTGELVTSSNRTADPPFAGGRLNQKRRLN